MELVHNETDLRRYANASSSRSSDASSPGARRRQTPVRASRTPILVDHFLEDATEVDVDCISDGETVVIGAIMEHIEEAGIHSGDSCVRHPAVYA